MKLPETLPPNVDEYASTLEMLRCAFGPEIPDHQYFMVLRLLIPGMSIRSAARFIELCGKCDYYEAIEHVMYVENVDISKIGGAELLEATRLRLLACGYAKWVAADA